MKGIIATIAGFVKHHREHLWQAGCVALIAWSGYNLGLVRAHNGALPAQSSVLLSARNSIVSRTPTPTGQGSLTPKTTTGHDDPRVVVSKSSSSKKYHHTWCSGASRIKEANRLWFPSAQAAQAAGYTLAGNCAE